MTHRLKKYLQDEGLTYETFGRLVGTSGQYIYHIISGFRRPGHKLALLIEETSGGKVGRSDLRPDIWPPSKLSISH